MKTSIILKRSFENVLALRVDVLKNSLVNSQSVKTQMSNYSLIELQFSDIEMIDFLSNHGVVVRKKNVVLQTSTAFKDNIESQVLRCQNQNTSKKVFVLYVNNIEILCDDEEFVYDKERLLPILFTRQLKKTVINPIIFSK
jgi:hypothetical protein